MKYIIIFLLNIMLILHTSCNKQQTSSHEDHEAPAISVTQWTDKMEFFMEYEIAIKDNPIKFIVHLTTLNDFKPVLEGELTLLFTDATGKSIEVQTNKILRHGIFTPVKSFENTGNYKFKLHYKGVSIEETFDVGEFVVYHDNSEIPRAEDEGEDGISYLKEQQWKTEFRSEPAKKMAIHASIMTMGEVLPRQQSYVELVSPVDGILDLALNRSMVNPGSGIKKGAKIMILKPPVDAANSWMEWFLAFERIKKEYLRAENLHQKNSISLDKFEKIKYDYLIQKAKYSAIFSENESENNIHFNLQENTLEVKSPITGIISDIDVPLGQKVSAGQRLMTIINPDRIWLKLNLFEKDFYRIDALQGVSLIIPGTDSLLAFDSSELKLLNKGSIIDPITRTIPLLVELPNSAGILKIGQTIQVDLYTSAHEEHLCVPRESIFDDDGKSVLFVHTEGESFEKRDVVTGGHNNGWIAILKGIKAGERVVTKGGYQVKLASTSAAIGHPHTH